MRETKMQNFDYDVALSFAGEQRDYVGRVAFELRNMEIRVFYDEFEDLWGDRLTEKLLSVFKDQSRFAVMFISKEYVEKIWPRHEGRAILNRAVEEKNKYVLPVRFDDTEVPGLPPDISHLNINDLQPKDLAKRIAQSVGKASCPDYEIYNSKDISSINAKRILYNVELKSVYSIDQGMMVAEDIINKYHKADALVNAVGFFFYFPGANTSSGRADGSIDWAPNGKWEDAGTVKTGDYASFRFEVRFWKERSMPTFYSSERKKVRIFGEIIQVERRASREADEGGGDIYEIQRKYYTLSEKYKNELARSYDLSREELLNISVEGLKNNWPFGLEDDE